MTSFFLDLHFLLFQKTVYHLQNFKQSFGVRSLHTSETAKAAVYLKAVNTALMQVGKMCVSTRKN